MRKLYIIAKNHELEVSSRANQAMEIYDHSIGDLPLKTLPHEKIYKFTGGRTRQMSTL